MFRSLSRAPGKSRERERSESRHGRRYDASSSTGGRRRRAAAAFPPRASSPGAPSCISKTPEVNKPLVKDLAAATVAAELPPATPRKERGRSLERSSRRRSGHVQRSPAKATDQALAMDSPRHCDARCLHSSTCDGDDRSPSPPAAPRLSAARTTPSPGPLTSRTEQHQAEKEGATPRLISPQPGQAQTHAPSAIRFKPGLFFTRRPRGPGNAKTHGGCIAQPTTTPPASQETERGRTCLQP